MKTLTQLSQELKVLNLVNPSFTVNVKEDEFEKTGDGNFTESNSFTSIQEAYEAFIKEVENGLVFESSSEYKEIELIVTDEEDFFEVLESERFVLEYTKEDYGKYLLYYRNNNNGIEGVRVEVIDSKTPYQVSAEGRYATKIEQFDTKEEVVKAIYDKMLYISMEEANELFEMSL